MVSNYPETLRSKTDYDRLFKNGRKLYPCSWLIINHNTNPAGNLRVGWTIPKFVGNAVVRNKMRRWCREIFRNSLAKLIHLRLDTNIVFRRQNKDFYKTLQYAEFETQLQKAFSRLA